MISITAGNINDAFVEGWWRLKTNSVEEPSRNGPVLVARYPVITTYLHPTERVLFNPVRDANPVFHLVEAIWMLAGSNDVESLLPFNSGYSAYANEGIVHGAYGHRWRVTFGVDQILGVIRVLKRDPASRQAVMAMWDPYSNDLEGNYKDRPCNTHIYFDCRGGKLNMTVCCRSNDMVWGAYGANVVHFSLLQELIAHGIGAPVGVYRQFSNNFHVYTENKTVKHFLENTPFETYDYYTSVVGAKVFPLLNGSETVEDLLEDAERFMRNESTYFTEFFTRVAHPLRCAYINRQAKDPDWRNFLKEVPNNNDWKIAFSEWVARRDAK